MTNGISEEVLERLEAEAKVADAEAEELTIAVESDLKDTEAEVEELQEDLEEKATEVEELQSDLEEKETEVEEMQEQIGEVASMYAEELAKGSDVLDAEDFREKFEFEELQEKYEALEDEPAEPNARSGDVGAGFQEPDEGAGVEGEEVELSEVEEMAASSFKDRARRPNKSYWAEIAEDIENGGE